MEGRIKSLKISQSTRREQRRRMMLEEPMMHVIPKVAIPMIISSMIDALYNLADTFFVSQLGKTATAAVAVNDSLMTVLRAISMGFAFGAASYISRLMGANENDRASNVATSTLTAGCVFSLFVGIVAFFFRDIIVMLMGSTTEAQHYAMDYAKWILLAAPFTTANLIMNQLLRSEGSTTYAMWGMVSGCLLNCVLDPIFIYTFGLEVEGAALATALSKMFSCVVLAIPYLRHTAMLELSPKHLYFDKESTIEVARMGIPAFLRMSLMSLGGIITNNVAKGFSTSVLAAISVANKIYRLVASAIMGFSQGFGPVAGFCLSAKKYKRVKQAYFSTIIIGSIGSLILGGLMIIFAKPLINVFNSEADALITEIGALKVRSLCIVFIPHIIVMVTSNLFQSLGRPVENMVLSMSRQLLFLIPLLFILPNIFGEHGLAVTQACSDLFSFLFLALPLGLKMVKTLDSLHYGDPSPY